MIEQDKEEISNKSQKTTNAATTTTTTRWTPSGSCWKDWLYFCGPGWLVSIAYVDPGNYQADIQAGATSKYNLLWTVWWASVLSIYVQVLCSRLAILGQITLAEVQRENFPQWFRYLCWAIAEFSVIITDLPEVIGFGIALNVFFGIPYYVGVLISPVTTILFLATQEVAGMRIMEAVIVLLIGVMSIALFVEMGMSNINGNEFIKGWVYGFALPNGHDIFSILGVLGAVVMPHNLYLHTASVMSRPCKRDLNVIKEAKFWVALEPVLPILVSFFINAAIVSIAAENVFGEPGADSAGNTNFGEYLNIIPGGSIMWGIALLAAAQSSSITTTYSGQYVMDGFLNLRIPVWQRAVGTRLVAIIPCVVIASTMDAEALNVTVNLVNALLALLLPFALTPLAKFCTSSKFLGDNVPPLWEKIIIWVGTFAVYAVNAYGLSAAGGGFFGTLMWPADGIQTTLSVQMNILNDIFQVLYLTWNVYVVCLPVQTPMRPLESTRVVEDEKCFGVVKTLHRSTSISFEKDLREEEEECCDA